MRKVLAFSLGIVFILGFYYGCAKRDMTMPTKVLFFKMDSNTWEKASDIAFLEITNKNDLQLFKNIINNSTKLPGIIDIAAPSFLVEIYYDNNPEVLLFNINEDKSMYVKKEDTNTGFNVNSQDIKKLLEIYGEYFK